MKPLSDTQRQAIEAFVGGTFRGRVLRDEPLSRHTTWGIGGPADYMLLPLEVASLSGAVKLLSGQAIPWAVIGGGSNILAADAGYRGALISLTSMNELNSSRVGDRWEVTAGAGASLAALVAFARRRGLPGMEGAAGIPGTVGGAIAGNAGAKDWDVAGSLIWAEVMDAEGNVARRQREELSFSYRRLELAPGELIVSGAFGFDRAGDTEEAIARINEVMAHRRKTQPLGERSAGSVFKNPPGDFAGRLIEAAGLKGERLGGAQVSPKHANFIVNTGGATAADVLGLTRRIRTRVKESCGVELELEIKVIG